MEEDTGPRGYFSRAEAGQPVESPVVFRAVLFATSEAKGAWVFVEVPTEVAPPVTGSWGMSPVLASVEGRSWHPTVWREKSGRTLLPVPKKIRQKLAIGDEVGVSVQLDGGRLVSDRQRLTGNVRPKAEPRWERSRKKLLD